MGQYLLVMYTARYNSPRDVCLYNLSEAIREMYKYYTFLVLQGSPFSESHTYAGQFLHTL